MMLLIGNYDVDSVMHYPPYECQKPGVSEPTIRLKNNRPWFTNRRPGLSPEDVRKIRILYECDVNYVDPEPIVSQCPKSMNSNVKNINGVQKPPCARVYDQSHCRGDSWDIESNMLYSDLSDWPLNVSSLEVNAGCAVTVCSSPNFANASCHIYDGDGYGRNIDTIPITKMMSIMCVCSECPYNVTYLDEGPNGTKYPLCGIIYDHTHCTGESKKFSIWKSPNLSSESKAGGGNWYHNVRSAEINPGCMMKLCSGASRTGKCTTREGGRNGYNAVAFNHNIASIWCSCGAGSYDSYNARHSITPPANAPTHVGGYRLCGVAVEMFKASSSYNWIRQGFSIRNRDQQQIFAYSYVVTRPGCTLYHCDEPDFRGQCFTLRPEQYMPTDGYYGLYMMKSYNCTCQW